MSYQEFRFTDEHGDGINMSSIHSQIATNLVTAKLTARREDLEKLTAFVCAIASIPRAQLGPHEVKASSLVMMARQLLEQLGIDEKKRAAVIDHTTRKNEHRGRGGRR